MRGAVLFLLLAGSVGRAVVIDRVAVVVNRRPIKLSDIDRDLRLTQFLNKEPLTLTAEDQKASEERLIDQQLIRTEIATSGYAGATDQDADALLGQIRADRYAGSDARLRDALKPYGLTEDELRNQLLWQLTVLRFIDERFRAAVLISEEDIQKYYDAHRAEFHEPLQAASASIRTALEGEETTREFESWLAGARSRASIVYQKEALP